jgi:hypothetical protein
MSAFFLDHFEARTAGFSPFGNGDATDVGNVGRASLRLIR